ncbi:MAG: hypothetical protein AAGJ08_04270 [Cyanobacteria bacterium P01_H01_bin.35]
MRNYLGQYIAGNGAAGAALLAFLASLFACSEAHAANLVRNGETGAVTRIEGLSVETDGNEKIYDVDFSFLSAQDVYGVGLDFDFDLISNAEAAAQAVMAELGSDEYTRQFGADFSDSFHIGYSRISRESYALIGDFEGRRGSDELDVDEFSVDEDNRFAPIAKFTEVVFAEPATTPEPNLIFAFITLGSLMLGSKIKNK